MEETSSKKLTQVQEEVKTKDPAHSKIVRSYKTLGQLWLSRKLWMTIIACGLLWLAYWREMIYLNHLATVLQTDKAQVFVPAFVSITRDFMLAFAAVSTAFVGVTGWIEWKHGTTSIVNQATSFVKQETQQKTETIQHVVEEGKDGAPVVKPFSGNAQ